MLAPAQRAAGGCSPLKATPGRGRRKAKIFSDLDFCYEEINDFITKYISILIIFFPNGV